MPYITQDKRDDLDEAILKLSHCLVREQGGLEGKVNYAITTLLTRLYVANYQDINNAIGVLECIKLELYRRLAAPYEDKKAIDNGDVY